ncbi:hypothetical protein BC829DRAFT_391709 [Chytridium lagenaria]|nr:hypothetical protein BC829DRAFT_391709 [Chytridium lagenaria]
MQTKLNFPILRPGQPRESLQTQTQPRQERKEPADDPVSHFDLTQSKVDIDPERLKRYGLVNLPYIESESRWNRVVDSLSQGFKHPEDNAIASYNPRLRTGKHIVSLALSLPELLPSDLIPQLPCGANVAITLSQRQVAALLANAFFCTFPSQKKLSASHLDTFPFLHICSAIPWRGKHRFMLSYCKGNITIHRVCVASEHFPSWETLREELSDVEVKDVGTIEDAGEDFIRMDFANKIIGVNWRDNEALVMLGSERFSSYNGYGSTFEWAGPYKEDASYDAYGRRKSSIVAIDAPLNKAYAGFLHSPFSSFDKTAPIATGHWGMVITKNSFNLV